MYEIDTYGNIYSFTYSIGKATKLNKSNFNKIS